VSSWVRLLSGGKKNSKKGSKNAWMKRHVQDPFVRQAQQKGHVSRSVYKLEQMDQKHNLLRKRNVVVDLGAAPGGWTCYVAKKLAKGSTLVAIDLLPLNPGVVQQIAEAPIDCHVLQGDFRSMHTKLQSILREKKASLVLSDMAANTTGDSQTDALRTMELCAAALDMAMGLLSQQGVFVAKYFSCRHEIELRNYARQYFDKVQVVKPPASRKESAERYLMAKGYHGP
jgi:23S rRNA (uridine2552-2'-O)-methyltransferase